MAHPTVRVVAIVNPSDGPGSSLQQRVHDRIAKLVAAGIQVIGYVATGYASHSIASMEATMDRWKSFYPQLAGIFFDEQSNQAKDVALLPDAVAVREGAGALYTVGNPGTDTADGLRRRARHDADLRDRRRPLRLADRRLHTKYAPSNFGIIPYNVSAMNASFVHRAQVRRLHLPEERRPAEPLGQPDVVLRRPARGARVAIVPSTDARRGDMASGSAPGEETFPGPRGDRDRERRPVRLV